MVVEHSICLGLNSVLMLQQCQGGAIDDVDHFDSFIRIFQIELIAKNLVRHLYDLPALESLLHFAKTLAREGQLSTWDLRGEGPNLIDEIEQKKRNSEMASGIIHNAHYIPVELPPSAHASAYGNRQYYHPCHICDELEGWRDNHISLHLEECDVGHDGPRWQYLDQNICVHCIGNKIQQTPAGYYDIDPDTLNFVAN